MAVQADLMAMVQTRMQAYQLAHAQCVALENERQTILARLSQLLTQLPAAREAMRQAHVALDTALTGANLPVT